MLICILFIARTINCVPCVCLVEVNNLINSAAELTLMEAACIMHVHMLKMTA